MQAIRSSILAALPRRLAILATVVTLAALPATGFSAPAQADADVQFRSLHDFSFSPSRRAGGANPLGGLVEGSDGSFYGAAYGGGANGLGTVYRLSATGRVTTLVSFDEAIGTNPTGELTIGNDGSLYGTTSSGGSVCAFCGTVFKIAPDRTFTVLHALDINLDGASPNGSLVQATDGNFYGTAYFGGPSGSGTLFRITPAGAMTVVYSFGSSFDSPSFPLGGLIQGTDGRLYGTSSGGGSFSGGTIYAVATDGTLTVLHSLKSSDGTAPRGSLVQGSDGHLYGTTSAGGQGASGTVFRISTSGVFQRLANLGGSVGNLAYAGLVQASDGNFYGTTFSGAADDAGAIFVMTPEGRLSLVHSLDVSEGASPQGKLLEASNGALLGTASGGGAMSSGSIFAIRR